MANCVSVTNHTDKPMEIVTIQDASVAESHRKSIHKIEPKETMVIFTDRVERLEWVRGA